MLPRQLRRYTRPGATANQVLRASILSKRRALLERLSAFTRGSQWVRFVSDGSIKGVPHLALLNPLLLSEFRNGGCLRRAL